MKVVYNGTNKHRNKNPEPTLFVFHRLNYVYN